MRFKNFELNGKTALITGGAGLLGVEHAAALLESGARVVITDIDDAKLNETKEKLNDLVKNDNLIIIKLDVTKSVDVEKTYQNLKKSNIRIDILINNAAIDPKVVKNKGLIENTRIENFSVEQWNLEISVGLTGAMLCSKVFGRAMAQDGLGGVILNISSDLSVISPDQRLYRKKEVHEDMQPVKPVTYSVIKSGLIGLTRYLATYWADKGVRCNALSPGGIYNNQDVEFVENISKLIPMGRMASSKEYRETVQYLCSNASRYLNGQNIIVDGGRSIL